MHNKSLNISEANEHLFAEQTQLMFGQTKKAVLGGLLSCILFTTIFWKVIDHLYLISWLTLITLLLILRGILNYAFLKNQNKNLTLTRWSSFYLVLTCAYGIAIGSASVVIHLTDEIAYHFLVIAWFIGYIALSVSAYSMNYKAVLALGIPIMTPLFASITMAGSTLHLLTGVVLIVWCIMIFSTMRPVNRSMIEAIKLNYELGLEIQKRMKIEEQLLELSIKDGLTGLFNRRHFDESYAKELKLAQRSKAELSIALIDIDYFKQFNDTYGHQAGDDCLCKVSEAIKHSVNRPNDLVARYGGEEIVVLMPNTNSEQAMYLAECMRKAVEKLEIAHKNSKVTNTATLSVSIGTATLEPNVSCDNIELLNFADKALYHAKDQGRNQTVVFAF